MNQIATLKHSSSENLPNAQAAPAQQWGTRPTGSLAMPRAGAGVCRGALDPNGGAKGWPQDCAALVKASSQGWWGWGCDALHKEAAWGQKRRPQEVHFSAFPSNSSL